MLIVDPQFLCIHLLFRIFRTLLTAGESCHFHVVSQPLWACLDSCYLWWRIFIDLFLGWFSVGFFGWLGAFDGCFSPAIIGDLLCLFRRGYGHPSLKLQFPMPSLNDRIPRPVALEVLPDQRPVARAMFTDNLCQLLVLFLTPLQ